MASQKFIPIAGQPHIGAPLLNIGLVVISGFSALGFSALSVFEVANRLEAGGFYQVNVLSEHGGAVRSSSGTEVHTDRLEIGRHDTLLIHTGPSHDSFTAGLLKLLQRAAVETRRLSSLGVGAFALGEAGLLDGRRVTTHWEHTEELQVRFPKAKVVDNQLFVADGTIWSSAGMTVCVDLALEMVERDLGREIALSVAKKMVVQQRRAGGQPQRSVLLELGARTDRVQDALAYARRNLRKSLSVTDLADAAFLSPRQFMRVFRAETGRSPAKVIEQMRLETARLMIAQGRLPIEAIAIETGFGDRERMRRAFLRVFGNPPQAVRRGS